ncbi:Protein of unknown function (DUF2889) [Burkholderia sp. Ch1-1]|uniref:DUF2889 domain-containing protein n=1 Tax=Paraburkholderia dioscoreae TaxID=2604047 RepID=A0A5Q4ZAF3_9BURK|nr:MULTISPECIES: DUF2889 domain-containing protein [Paraburkholderia]EIF35718.1 Protein of unknown function (DUF2889) [Burkholderia sp. Ch1-1]MDR8400448.1 DUF2889 domain-containing protein [Paraburkholderia sp. USG1]VVD31639.1 conserved protein of unknown function [Paraburkholderia dioscoreae]
MSAIPSDRSTRRVVHTRRIECIGFERSDGLFDIEGHIRDTKAEDSDLLFKTVPAGSPIHDMRIVVTIDSNLLIHRIEAHTDSSPSRFCTEINEAYARLEGVTIGAGFMKEVKSRLSGPKGCTHLTELLGPIATTAIQTLMGWRKAAPATSESADAAGSAQAHPMVDTCYAWRAGGDVVQFVSRRKQEPARGDALAAEATRPPDR